MNSYEHFCQISVAWLLHSDFGKNLKIEKSYFFCESILAIFDDHTLQEYQLTSNEWCTFLRSSFSIANQIKFYLRFTDLRSTSCSELIVNQLFRFSMHFRSPITWSVISWSAVNWAYFMPIWLADSELNLRCCAKLPSMRCEWMP